MNRFVILKWDSNFFGFSVAEILQKQQTPDELNRTIKQLKSKNVKLAYLSIPPNDIATNSAALSHQGLLVDKKLTYQCELHSTKIFTIESEYSIESYSGNINKDLEKLAILSGINSRYKTDRHFPEILFKKLYIQWMHNSLNRTFDDEVFIAKQNSKILGMVTVRKINNKTAKIGIISVFEKYRGKGIGTALIDNTKYWAISNRCQYLQVVTQHANLQGRRLYKKCGFKLIQAENFYHFWL